MTTLKSVLLLSMTAVLTFWVALGPVEAAQRKSLNDLLVGKQTLTISPTQQKSVLAAPKGGLSFGCNGVFCACTGDVDCNDMFTTNVCGPRAICYGSVCYCERK